mmetsp:Transcript_11065/g.24296  ORF Transcript_11065/g.24296 Transcript_11065/m.24296 type:complete len:221 (-) Transcript_11065:627-1289(-)
MLVHPHNCSAASVPCGSAALACGTKSLLPSIGEHKQQVCTDADHNEQRKNVGGAQLRHRTPRLLAAKNVRHVRDWDRNKNQHNADNAQHAAACVPHQKYQDLAQANRPETPTADAMADTRSVDPAASQTSPKGKPSHGIRNRAAFTVNSFSAPEPSRISILEESELCACAIGCSSRNRNCSKSALAAATAGANIGSLVSIVGSGTKKEKCDLTLVNGGGL